MHGQLGRALRAPSCGTSRRRANSARRQCRRPRTSIAGGGRLEPSVPVLASHCAHVRVEQRSRQSPQVVCLTHPARHPGRAAARVRQWPRAGHRQRTGGPCRWAHQCGAECGPRDLAAVRDAPGRGLKKSRNKARRRGPRGSMGPCRKVERRPQASVGRATRPDGIQGCRMRASRKAWRAKKATGLACPCEVAGKRQTTACREKSRRDAASTAQRASEAEPMAAKVEQPRTGADEKASH
ncbi:hypothetical protein ERJ75_001261600 [Trypanosoma vivax]|nr:hypothetical protein ERJ75_001261600 [Trypanosoma vivax]